MCQTDYMIYFLIIPVILQHGDLNKQNTADRKLLEEKEQIIKVC